MVRDRRPADVPRCVEILADLHRGDRYPLNWPADPPGWLSPPRAVHAWVAERASLVVGHVAVHRAQAGGLEVGRLFVAPAARRHGVARALLDHVRGWATGDLTLEIVDAPRSAAAIALYERTGWQRTHTTTATWTTADGSPVRLHHYRVGGRSLS